MPARIGILTYFWRDNPGTFLQAYGMLRAFQERFGAENVELIDFRLERSGFRLSRNDLNPVTFLDHLRRHRLFSRCRGDHLRFSESGLVSTDPKKAADFIASLGYDAVVVGSDTVLELGGAYVRHWGGRIPVYWLPPEVPGIKIACAASAGAETGTGLDESTREVLRQSIEDFALVGVRDDASLQLMRALGLGDDPRLARVPDPTFACDVDPGPAEALARRLGLDDGTPVIGVNLPRMDVFRELLADYRRKGYKVLSLQRNREADFVARAISPFEWAGLPRFLRLVITDRFHGSIFSLLAGTPVVAVDYKAVRYNAAGLSKTYSLLKEFGLDETNHVNLVLSDVEGAGHLREIIDHAVESFDAARVRRCAEEMRERFRAFLSRVNGLLVPNADNGRHASAGAGGRDRGASESGFAGVNREGLI